MAISLGQNSYGESGIRLLRVMPRGDLREVKDLSLSIRFEGDFDAAHTRGENCKILPSDTMKNTIYILAAQYPAEAIEEFGLHIAEHFFTYNPQVSAIAMEINERPWSRIALGDKPHGFVFTAGGLETRTARISAQRERVMVRSGIENLRLLKTTGTSFAGFLRDPYTSLPENPDRLLSITLRAEWTHQHQSAEDGISYSASWQGVRKILLETFVTKQAHSLQNLLHALGEAVLDAFDGISEIHLSATDHHCALVDLKPFGMENRNEILVPSEEGGAVAEALLHRNRASV